MPMANTSLDKYYSTTAHWDPWKVYKELVNEESANGAKKQVIKREFNGVTQYNEERRRQTEGDKLFIVDLSKTIVKFKQAIDQARINIEDGRLNPLADLFFQFNNLMISYQNYNKERSTTPSNISDIKKQFTDFIPTLKQLQAVFNTFVEQARMEGTLKNYDLVASVQFQEMLNNLESNYFNVITLANDLSDIARQEEMLNRMKEREIRTREAEVAFQQQLAQITEVQGKIDELTRQIDELDQKREVILEERILYQRRSKIARQLDIELDRIDTTIAKYRADIIQLRKLLPGSGSTSGSGMFNKPKYGGAFDKTDVVDNFKSLIKESLDKRAGLYHSLNNKNLSQDEVIELNQKLQSVNKNITYYVDKLQTATLAELSEILQEDRSKIEQASLNKEAPNGYQFVLDPITGATVLKPINPTVPSDKQKQDIQPMIKNAGQIIASENASYTAFKTGNISQDQLDVKRSGALSDLVPLLKAIVVVKQDEGIALYAGINDPEFKKSVGDAVPEVTTTGSFTPMPPPPPPPEPPAPPAPSEDKDKKAYDDAMSEFRNTVGNASMAMSDKTGADLEAYFDSIVPTLVKDFKLIESSPAKDPSVNTDNLKNSMNSLGDLRQKFDNALNPPPKQMTPTEGYQAYQSLLNDARTQKISLTGDALKAYYTSIVSDLVKYYNLAIQLGGNVNTKTLHGLLNQVDPDLTTMFDAVLNGSGKRGRGRPPKGGRDKEALKYEYVKADEFYKKSFSNLKKPKEGDVIYGKEVPDVLFSNPGLGRVDKYTEGSGAFFNPSAGSFHNQRVIGGADLVSYNKSLLDKLGMPVGGKKKGHRKTKPKSDEI